ncbi:MAG: FAD-binding protein [Vicinamibacteria bacterium]
MRPIEEWSTIRLESDLLIVGGGTAGCMAAIEAKERSPRTSVVVIDKAHVDRSGCLAGGMNAINAYLNPGESPESFTRFVRADNLGIIREDLVLSQAKLFEYSVKRVESWGLPVKKRPDGVYQPRGRWNIKINGESIKPILAKRLKQSGAKIMNWVVATNFIREGDRILGAYAFSLRKKEFYVIKAKATIVSTGGAAGL